MGDLLRRVQAYGLDEAEVHLYYHLCRLGPSRAAAVAEAAGRKRTDAYRVLDRLVEKGFAEKSLERPARYLPHLPEQALQRALALRRAHLDTLETERAALAGAWPRAVSPAPQARQRFAVHQGWAQVNALLQRMVASAQEEVLVATSADGLSRIDGAGLSQALAARAGAGAMVRVLAKRGRGGDLPLAGLAASASVRYGDLPTFYQAVIVDAREIALFVSAGKGISGPEESVLWLNSSDVVLAQKALFDLAWDRALSRRELEADGTPRQAQVLRGRWVRTSRLKEMILAARRSLRIDAPAGEVEAWGRSGVLAALAQRAKGGVEVRLRAPPGTPAVPGCAMEHGPVATFLAVADGTQALVALPGEDAAGEWAVWSTHPEMAALLAPGEAGVVRQERTAHT